MIMKTSTLKCIAAFSLLFIIAGLQAQNRYRVEDVPNVQLQDYTRYVSDPENALDIGDVLLLDERLAWLRDSLALETAIVVLPAIDTRQYGSAKEFATELFNRWGIGDKEIHNGLLILLLTADGEREIVFETGYGTEKVLTDGFCKLIQVQKMVPFLKEGAYGEGLIVGVEEVEKIFNGTSEFQVKKPLLSPGWKLTLIWLVGGLILIPIVERMRKKRIVESDDPFVNAANYKSLSGIGCVMATLFFPSYFLYMLYKEFAKKEDMPRLNCEKCGAKGQVVLKYKPQVEQKAIPGQDGLKRYHFICEACNHGYKVLVPYKYVAPQTSSGGGSSFSSSSGSSYSSSSRGGSWGGGRSGGGGASTKF
ncbi:MAG: TPM domain-containing protein [Fermentimonas sp.]